VVTHPALQPQRTHTGVDEHRRARVAESVKADAVESGTLRGGDEYPPAQAALIGGAARAPREHECVLGRLTRAVRVQHAGQLWRQRDQPRAVARLRCDDRTPDDRALNVKVRRRALEHEIAPA
jgi:hypothetical protein